MERYGYVYKITNKVNGKIYVGKRESSIFDEKYFASGKVITYAFKKYGMKNFDREIIEWCPTKDILCERERFWINELDSWLNGGKGYNIHEGGIGGNTLKGYTEEDMKKFKQNISNGFKNMSPEKRAKWQSNCNASRVILTGEKNGMHGVRRFGEANPMFGKKQSIESRKKNSESNKDIQAGYKSPQARHIRLFKNNEFKGNYGTMTEAAEGNSMCVKQIRKMLRGWIPPENSKYAGWSAIELENYEEYIS